MSKRLLRYRQVVVKGRDVVLTDDEEIVAYGYDPRDDRFLALVVTHAEDIEEGAVDA